MQNSGDNVLLNQYLAARDFSDHSVRALRNDYKKFTRWFEQRINEPFASASVVARDVMEFRDSLRGAQSICTINRCLVMLRKFFDWLCQNRHIEANPFRGVKELRRQSLCPKGLDHAEVRRLIRETELRGDLRAAAIFSLMLYSGARVGDVASLELTDLQLNDRSGSAVFRFGKGGKQRTVPLCNAARKALRQYLESRPPCQTNKVFIGERGALTERGIRALTDKYSAICGITIHPHLFRHTFAHQYLSDNNNDLVGLASIAGWENLQTAMRYTKKTQDALALATERIAY